MRASSILSKSVADRRRCLWIIRETFPSLPDPPHLLAAVLVARPSCASHNSMTALPIGQATTLPASSKNSTPARPLASFLTGAPDRTGVDFLPSSRSLERRKNYCLFFNILLGGVAS